jgi:hypothetical protein
MEEEEKTAIRISGKSLLDLFDGMKTKEDLQLERLENVERLTDIIHKYRVKRARSKEIASAIIKFVREGD